MVVFTLWLLSAGFLVLTAVRHLNAGVRATTAAEAGIKPATVTQPLALVLLDGARSEFSAADAELGSPVLAPLRVLPVIGRQITAVRAMSHAAASVAATGRAAVQKAQEALGARRSTGPERLAAVRSLADDATMADTALQHVDLGPSVGLVGVVRAKHNQFLTRLIRIERGIHRGSTSAQAVAALLSGQHRLLVLAGNNGEMRNGSGMFLAVTSIDISDGSLTVGQFQDAGALELAPGAVALAPDAAGPWGFLAPNQEWRNLGLSARFDSTAALAAQMWKARSGQDVTDVMAIDIAAFQFLVRATGPVQAGGLTLDATSVVPFLLHDQYASADQSVTANLTRRDALGAIAQGVLGSVQTGHYEPSQVVSQLSQVVSGRHLMMWSADAATEARWSNVGASGQMLADALIVTLQNRGANKLDQFVSVATELAVRPGEPGRQQTSFTANVLITNAIPAGQPPYIAGDGEVADLPFGTYLGYVTVTMPATASDVMVDGQAGADVKGADGPTQVVAVVRRIPPGGSIDVAVTFTLPVLHGHVQVGASARIPAATYQLNGPNPSLPIADDQRPRIEW